MLGRRVLCVAAHPDDEVLGAGATMATMAAAGAEVHALVLGEGVGARHADNDRADEEVATLAGQLQDAARILGVTTHQEGLPDNRFDSMDLLDVVHIVERYVDEMRPDVVFTHHAGDMNLDHLVTARATLTALRPLPELARPSTLLAFETLSSTEWNVPSLGMPFTPNWFEDASEGIDAKIEAMRAYDHELRDWPHPRSPEGIRTAAQRWGMTVGLEFAEPFALLRYVGD
jgi:N-acetylglucosamine malate deacetylase 1